MYLAVLSLTLEGNYSTCIIKHMYKHMGHVDAKNSTKACYLLMTHLNSILCNSAFKLH